MTFEKQNKKKFRTKLIQPTIFSGANQLLWYYADLEKKRCYNQHLENVTTRAFHKGSNLAIANITGNAEPYIEIEINHCLAWRRFAK